MNTRILWPWAVAALAAVLLGGCTKSAREARLLAKADRDLAALGYDRAEAEYNRARQLAPLDPVAMRKLGILYHQEGRLFPAYALLSRSLELSPTDARTRIRLAQVDFELSGFKLAREGATTVLRDRPTDEDALVVLGDTTRTPAEAEETHRLVATLRQNHGDMPGYHIAEAASRLARRDLKGAADELRAALKLQPNSVAAHERLARVLLLEGDSTAADGEFHVAARLAPLRSLATVADLGYRLRTAPDAQARKDLADLNRDAPDYIPGWILAMHFAFSEHRYDDCSGILQKVLFRDPSNIDALLERGQVDLAKDDAPAALADFQKAEKLYPKHPELKYQLAIAYARTGDTGRARERLREALVVAPTYSRATLLLSDLDLREGNTAEAVVQLEGELARSPHDRDAYLLLAQAYLSRRDTTQGDDATDRAAQARAIYDRMAKVFPTDPEPWYRTGMIWVQEKNGGEARRCFERATALSPEYVPALNMLISLDLAQRRPAAASGRVDALISENPKWAAAWTLQSRVDWAQHHEKEAEADLLKAIALQPDYSQAYLLLARLYTSEHRTADAVKRLTALVDRTKSVSAQMQIAAIHSELKDYPAAAADYRKALALDPRFEAALNNLAYIDSENLNRVDEAYALARQARQIGPENANAADTLGWILFKRGDYHGALDLLQDSAGRAPGDATVQYHLGRVYYMLGQEEPARVAFTRVVALGADTPVAAEAKSRLAVLAVNPSNAGASVQADLERRAKADPADPIVAARLAAIGARDESPAQAAVKLKAALKLEPHNSDLMLDLAEFYSGPLHQPAKARELAKSAHEIAPDDPQVSRMLSRLLYRTGDFRWSLDLLEGAARALPHDPRLMYDLAVGRYAVGQVAEAEAALASVRDASGFDRHAQAERFARLLAAGRSPEAAVAGASEARAMLASDPHYLPALMVSALAREADGDAAGAASLYENMLAEDPAFATASRRLSRIYAQRMDNDGRAYDLAVQARQAYPDDPDVAMTLGIIDYRRRDFGAAARLFQESLGRRQNAEALYYLGMSHFNLSENAESKGELEQALQSKLPDREADQARQALDEMNGQMQGPSLTSQPIN